MLIVEAEVTVLNDDQFGPAVQADSKGALRLRRRVAFSISKVSQSKYKVAGILVRKARYRSGEDLQSRRAVPIGLRIIVRLPCHCASVEVPCIYSIRNGR